MRKAFTLLTVVVLTIVAALVPQNAANARSAQAASISGFPAIPSSCNGVSDEFDYGYYFNQDYYNRTDYPGNGFCLHTRNAADVNKIAVLYLTNAGHLILVGCYRGATSCTEVWGSQMTDMKSMQWLSNCMMQTNKPNEHVYYGSPGKDTKYYPVCESVVSLSGQAQTPHWEVIYQNEYLNIDRGVVFARP